MLNLSFDPRYAPMGQPTGSDWYPGFVARSRTNPGLELKHSKVWGNAWKDAVRRFTKYGASISYRWYSENSMCAEYLSVGRHRTCPNGLFCRRRGRKMP